MTDPNKAHRRPNTQAYLRLRERTQALFDFAVLVAHAVPTLNEQLACVQQQTRAALPQPDHFVAGTTSVAQLQQSAGDYLPQLAAYTLLGAFSFFEAFVSDAVEEMFAFHGGVDEMCRRADARDA